MKKSLLIVVMSATLTLFASGSQCPSNFYNGEAPDIINQKLQPKTIELCYDGFAVKYSGLSKTPLYSAEYLTREKIAVKLVRKDEFHIDDRIPASERSELSDYARSGYDRGHMTPSADMGSEKAMYDSFSLANIVPQDGKSNRGIWSDLEGATRHIANKEGGVFVITGPLFQGSDIKAIGKNNVLVPTQVYKVIYSPKQQKGAVYIVNNLPEDTYKVISISELEKLSGISYFPKLSDAQKSQLLELPVPRKKGK